MKLSITKMLPFAVLLPATSAANGLQGLFDFLSTQSDSDSSDNCETVMDQFMHGKFDPENIEMIASMNEKFQLYCSDPSSSTNKICAEASTLIEGGKVNFGSLQQIKATSFSVSMFCETDFLAEHKELSDFVSMATTLTTQDILEVGATMAAPKPKLENGMKCFDSGSCSSGRCDATGNGKICMEKLEKGSRCNEKSDCKSNTCKANKFAGKRYCQ